MNFSRVSSPASLLFYPRFILLTLGLTLCVQPAALADWYKQQRDIMGTRISVELWHESAEIAASCSDRIFAEMHRIDALMSPFKSSSELSFINNNAAISAIEISAELAHLIERSLYFSEISQGAFDITYASVGYAYDYRKRLKPSDQAVALRLDAIDYRHINLQGRQLQFLHSDVRIDLGGIAKGYAVDQAIDMVRSCGISQAMISAGGDSRILGDKRGRSWIIGIQHPRQSDQVALILPLSDTAISTSGDYERFYIDNGERVHHIINPATGRSARASWSATVTGADAMTTDALSTTIFVLGAIKGMALIETLDGIDAIIIDSSGKLHYSSGLQPPEVE